MKETKMIIGLFKTNEKIMLATLGDVRKIFDGQELRNINLNIGPCLYQDVCSYEIVADLNVDMSYLSLIKNVCNDIFMINSCRQNGYESEI